MNTASMMMLGKLWYVKMILVNINSFLPAYHYIDNYEYTLIEQSKLIIEYSATYAQS